MSKNVPERPERPERLKCQESVPAWWHPESGGLCGNFIDWMLTTKELTAKNRVRFLCSQHLLGDLKNRPVGDDLITLKRIAPLVGDLFL